mmetsp:Transcript_3790/g.9244  ORF Transcript_3790/g.9244 Transcript_3790/m.9244 type:complete len:260 (-) Transcript_3790:1343-2122(-)
MLCSRTWSGSSPRGALLSLFSSSPLFAPRCAEPWPRAKPFEDEDEEVVNTLVFARLLPDVTTARSTSMRPIGNPVAGSTEPPMRPLAGSLGGPEPSSSSETTSPSSRSSIRMLLFLSRSGGTETGSGGSVPRARVLSRSLLRLPRLLSRSPEADACEAGSPPRALCLWVLRLARVLCRSPPDAEEGSSSTKALPCPRPFWLCLLWLCLLPLCLLPGDEAADDAEEAEDAGAAGCAPAALLLDAVSSSVSSSSSLSPFSP